MLVFENINLLDTLRTDFHASRLPCVAIKLYADYLLFSICKLQKTLMGSGVRKDLTCDAPNLFIDCHGRSRPYPARVSFGWFR